MSKDLLGAADAILQRNSAPVEVQDSQFARGLRSGALGAGSQLATLGGTIADRLGFDGQPLIEKGQDLSLRAAEAAPRVSRFADVNSLRDFGDYAAGLAGQMVPVGAAALAGGALTRGGAFAKSVGAAVPMVPLETGDVLQRQAAEGQQSDLGSAALAGISSAALQGVAPGLAAAKLAGTAGRLAARGGAAGTIAKNVGGEAALNAATGAGGEAIKQSATGQDDAEALREAALGGAVGGAMFGAVGAAGDLAHGAKGDAKAAGAAVGSKLDAAKGAAAEGVEKTAQTASKGLDAFLDRIGAAKDEAGDAYDRVIKGKPLSDDAAYRDTPADSPAYKSLLDKLDNEHTQAAMKWGQDMLDKAGDWLTPERKAQLEEAMGNLGDAANRATIATMAKARDAMHDARRGADKLKAAIEDWVKGRDGMTIDGEVRDVTPSNAKRLKSEDYSGIRQTISDEMLPLIEKHNPGLLDDPEAMTSVAESVRKALQVLQAGGALPKDVRNELYDTLGPKTGLLLDKLNRMSGSKDAQDKFYTELNSAKKLRGVEDNLHDAMMKLLKPELQESTKTSQIRADARDLMNWARREDRGGPRDQFNADKVNTYLEERYGPNADKVMKAVEKAVRDEDLQLDKDAADRGLDSDEVGAGEDDGSRLPTTTGEPGKIPGMQNRSGDAMLPEEAKSLKWEGGKGSDDRRTSPRALKTEAGTFDAVKITGSQRLEHYERPSLERDAHAFADGIAKLTEQTGKKIDVPDSTVINERGTTWGEAKKLLAQDSGPSTTEAKHKAKLTELRDKYRAAKAVNDVREMDRIAREADFEIKKYEDSRDANISGQNVEDKRTGARDRTYERTDEDGNRTITHSRDDAVSPAERAMEGEYYKSGKEDVDPLHDPIQLVDALGKLEPAKEDYSGQKLRYDTKPSKEGMLGALDSKIQRMENAKTSDGTRINKTARALAEKARALQPLFESMSKMDQASLLSIVKAEKLSDAAGTINALHKKYVEQAAPEVAAQSPKDRLVARARSGDPELIKEIAKHDDAAQLQRALDHLNAKGVKGEAVEALNRRIGELAQNPDVAYNLQRTSAQSTGSAKANTPENTAKMAEYLDRVLGPSIKRAWAKIDHAGEFDATNEAIRVSVHALDPLSVAHHEALHAFLHKLRQAGDSDTVRTLMKAADSPIVRRQLEKLLAKEPEALKQLDDAEERVAYMYQFWAADPKGFKVGPETKGVLTKLKEFFRNILGTWSNDERALHILEHFHQGDFAKDPSGFSKAMNEAGRNRVLEKARAMTEPLAQLSDSVLAAGAQRLRDTGIPALRELADAMKVRTTDESGDHGFIQSARTERTRMLNGLGEALAGFSKEHINDALEALQSGDYKNAATREGKLAARTVQKILADVKTYMQQAGVKVNDLGDRYFPRVYDLDYVSRHQTEFRTVLEKYGVKDPQGVVNKLMTADGNEFQVETMKPGMQYLKERKLKDIPDAELAPFMQKDLFQIMNSYVTQATRRAEWARRFGDDGARVNELMTKAKEQGATERELQVAERFVRGVDGTLGDTLNPTARRLMGDMIVYQNIRLLPLAIFSSVVDPLGIVVRGGTVGDAWKTFTRGIREIKKNFQNSPESDASTQLAEAMGTIDNAAMVHTLGALYSQGMVGDTGRKINDAFFRYNLMEQFNSSMRVGATEAALKFLTKHADGKASQHSARWLAELGLMPGDVQYDAALGRPKLFQHEGLTAEQEGKMRAAVNRWVDGAVLRPDAADKPIWMNDPHWALVAHLKQFVYSFHETILKRVAHEMEHGNYTPAVALASYVPVMIASDFVKGMIQGGGEEPEWKRNWTAGDYVWSGVERAGLLGTGQFRADMLGDVSKGGIGVGALAGPTIEQLTDAVRVMGGRESAGHFALKSMPANALYAGALGGPATDPKFAD